VADRPKETRWIIKAPFTTNSQHFKHYVNTARETIQHIASVVRDLYSSHPSCYEINYLLFQERVTKNGECKLCFLNKQFSHFVSSTTTRKSLPGYTQKDLISFAQKALESLRVHEDTFILDGLLRVDLFKSNEGKLVVNELESLEACYFSSTLGESSQCDQYLEEYWEIQINECLCNLFTFCTSFKR
jgi:hypothetical protein